MGRLELKVWLVQVFKFSLRESPGGISPVDSEQSKIWGSLKISRRNPCSPFLVSVIA